MEAEFKRAIQLQQTGNLTEAETIYLTLLKKAPNHPELLHALGLIAYARNQLTSAVSYITQAIKASPRKASFHSNLGLIYKDMLNHAQAEQSFKQALVLQPEFDNARINLAQLYLKSDQLELAKEVIAPLRQSTTYSTPLYQTLGLICSFENNYELAINYFEKILTTDPYNSEIYNSLGSCFIKLGQFANAQQMLLKALDLAPDTAEIYLNCGKLYIEQQQYEKAIAAFEKCVTLMTARPYLDEMMRANCRVGCATSQLYLQQYPQAWDNYEYRFLVANEYHPAKKFPFPLWNGEPLTEGALLLHDEQGVGDNILFGQFIPLVLQRVKHCFVRLRPKLIPLFSRNFPHITFLSKYDEIEWSHYPTIRAICWLGSLPKYCPIAYDPKHKLAPYLTSDTEKRQLYRAQLQAMAKGKKIIGLSWYTSNPNQTHYRSIDPVELFNTINPHDYFWVNCQYGDCAEVINTIKEKFQISIYETPDLDIFDDLDGLACLLSALDLLITVDNATIHLAGSLNVSSLLLLSTQSYWCWGPQQTETCFWYPSIKLIRQAEQNIWQDCFDNINRLLQHEK